MDRYSRQSVLPQIGVVGQQKIAAARVAVVGVGALGSVTAQLCARAGIGTIRLIDRDIVEVTNLQRQVLFNETDALQKSAKASAAKKHLESVNSSIQIEAVVEDLHAANIDELLKDIDFILDGTDNFETRYVLNDFAVKNSVPFIYCGAIETRGMVYAVLPDGRPCLRCLFPESPSAHQSQTCDRTGILSSASHIAASWQFSLLVKLIAEGAAAIKNELFSFDVWRGVESRIPAGEIAVHCECCSKEIFPALVPDAGLQALKLCGRNSVQISPDPKNGFQFEKWAEQWNGTNGVIIGTDIACVKLPDYELMLFKNGRVIVKGTEDPVLAKSVYARWIGC